MGCSESSAPVMLQVAMPALSTARSSDSQCLVKMGPEGVAMFQKLLDKTHKAKDNWTRDRGCTLHGQHCPPDQKKCKFHHKCPVPERFKVRAVMQNTNSDLWEQYSLNRSVICQECESGAGKPFRPVKDVKTLGLLEDAPMVEKCNEWFLFHGSSPDNCLSIAKNNFELGLAGTGATWKNPGTKKGVPLYGNGIYFAESVTKADEYSERVPAGEAYAGCHALLVCRVAGGRTQWCDTDKIDSASLQKQIISGPFHSVFGDRVSKLGKPYREIVVYDAAQCYPEYVVYYEREYSESSAKEAKELPTLLPKSRNKARPRLARYDKELKLQEREEQELEGGKRYKGQWCENQWHGSGVLTKPDGQRYEGSFANGRAHGHGRFVDRDGSMYDGQWDQDRMHGYGKFSKKDGSTYKGEWYQNEKLGNGREEYCDGGFYEGEFKHGTKNGVGIYHSGTGIVYEGQFLNDKMDGEGCYKFVDGRIHVGQFKEGHMNGLGRMEWPNGAVYEGQYENDMKHGEGTYTWPSGRAWTGQWFKGQQQGSGMTFEPTEHASHRVRRVKPTLPK